MKYLTTGRTVNRKVGGEEILMSHKKGRKRKGGVVRNKSFFPPPEISVKLKKGT